MIDQLQVLVELVARASWQASLLAAIVGVVVWCFGNRLAARWRYLLWSLVLVRMLLLVAPVSSWSLYRFARWDFGQAETQVTNLRPAATDELAAIETPPATIPVASPPKGHDKLADGNPALASQTTPLPSQTNAETQPQRTLPATSETPATAMLTHAQWLAIGWFLGTLVFGGRLLWAYFALRRKLARCQPVQDEALLRTLESTQRTLGIRRRIDLLVTAEPISPCVVGAWRPQLVMPELALTELNERSLRQVCCHELAHVARGDLWTNWLMLCARCLHWFNPVAWWMVREMQSLREMACDERTLTALDADQRQDYADTILSLIGMLAPSPLAPGMVALFSSQARLSRRIEHIALGSCGSRRSRIAACLVLVILALAGWTDAGRIAAQQPGEAQPLPLSDANGQATTKTEVAPMSDAADYTLRGQTVKWISTGEQNRFDVLPMGHVKITLYRIRGMLGSPEALAATTSDADGHFAFSGLQRPRVRHHFDRLAYGYVMHAPGQLPVVVSHYEDLQHTADGDRIDAEGVAHNFAGRLVDPSGKPIEGAIIYRSGIHQQPVPGVYSTSTDKDG
jgi:beta-lactamase regulating signal transducer with metallopeptidase domain